MLPLTSWQPRAFNFAKSASLRVLLLSVGAFVFAAPSGSAQALMPPINAPAATETRAIAQAPPPPNQGDELPIDLSPVDLPERSAGLSSLQTSALYKLPGRMFFDANVENSGRLDTNVFATLNRNRADYVYRILPNVTLGYAFTPKTRISTNYFYLRDNYSLNAHALDRSIHSIGFALNHDFTLNPSTTVTTGFMARQLLITRSPALSDFLPSVVAVKRMSPKSYLYSSATGQFRFRDTVREYQEVDQFYSFGGIRRDQKWTFLADTTFVSNLGKVRLRQGHNNQMFILTMEADRPIVRGLPVVAFVRAQPIFNIGANASPGYAGFEFRLFGGIRLDLSKPAVFPVKLPTGEI